MKILVSLTDTEYAMIKAYAAARRKYESGKGFRVEHAIAYAIAIGIESLSETVILDKKGEPVDWKGEFCFSEEDAAERKIYRKY